MFSIYTQTHVRTKLFDGSKASLWKIEILPGIVTPATFPVSVVGQDRPITRRSCMSMGSIPKAGMNVGNPFGPVTTSPFG